MDIQTNLLKINLINDVLLYRYKAIKSSQLNRQNILS